LRGFQASIRSPNIACAKFITVLPRMAFAEAENKGIKGNNAMLGLGFGCLQDNLAKGCNDEGGIFALLEQLGQGVIEGFNADRRSVT
jgi:hypothetical protein